MNVINKSNHHFLQEKLVAFLFIGRFLLIEIGLKCMKFTILKSNSIVSEDWLIYNIGIKYIRSANTIVGNDKNTRIFSS